MACWQLPYCALLPSAPAPKSLPSSGEITKREQSGLFYKGHGVALAIDRRKRVLGFSPMGSPLLLLHPSYRACPPTSHGLRLGPVHTPKHKKQLSQSQRTLKVLSFYGLTTPPYELDALEPYMSKRTLELHWGKHHNDYVESLNKQLVNSPLYGYTMEELIKATYNNGNPLPEFNNAAEVWNHDFFWESMQPDGGKLPWGGVLQQIEKDFGSFPNFREEFVLSAMTLFGSGWVWLVLKSEEKRLSVVRTSNAVCPLVWGDIPIIGLDMWEHAYYLDYKDDRGKYVNAFMNHLVSWHAATARMARAESFVNLGEPKIPVA